MREQVCIYMCPYARFQSAMFDKDTLIVSYDAARGEPRGPRKIGADPRAHGLGDCIDCTFCVQVCPTGIDIRDGLQYECINCALCIDACNSIMDKMGYARGLVSYTTENRLAGKGWTWKRIKLVGYGVAIVCMITLFITVLALREPIGLDVIRHRGQLYQEVPGGKIQNTFTIKVLNMDDADHVYDLSVTGLPSPVLVPDNAIAVAAESVEEVSVSVQVDPDRLGSVHKEIEFHVKARDAKWRAESDSQFFGPRIEP
jgi:cytochrome c oxidase accessory protein FixG